MTQRVSPRRAIHAPQMISMRAVLGSSDVDLATTIVPDSASTGSLRDFLHLVLSDHHRTGVGPDIASITRSTVSARRRASKFSVRFTH